MGRTKVEQSEPQKAEQMTHLRRKELSYHAIAKESKFSSVWRFLQREKADPEREELVN